MKRFNRRSHLTQSIAYLLMLVGVATAHAADQPKKPTEAEAKAAIKTLDAAMESIDAMTDNGEIAAMRFKSTCDRVVGMPTFCGCLKKSLAVGVTWHEQGWLVYSEMMNQQIFPLKIDLYGQPVTEASRREIFASAVQARNKCIGENAKSPDQAK
jgi:hypothetical protein